MNLYQVRIFKNNQWNVIRTYESSQKAVEFAEILTTTWDVKEVSLVEANS
jgi:hypothetical protein